MEKTMRTAQPIRVEVAPGELIDKITILRIKTERIDDPAKLKNVRTELEALERARDESIRPTKELDALEAELQQVNEALWEIEDDIRHCERRKDLGPKFIELARAVYQTNDRRWAIKRQINELIGSKIVGERSYAEY
jgi:hypothetical protein